MIQNSDAKWTYQNPLNNFQTFVEPFCLSLVNTPIIMNVPKTILQYHRTLKSITVQFRNTTDITKTPLR
jgi:hypothetical protein